MGLFGLAISLLCPLPRLLQALALAMRTSTRPGGNLIVGMIDCDTSRKDEKLFNAANATGEYDLDLQVNVVYASQTVAGRLACHTVRIAGTNEFTQTTRRLTKLSKMRRTNGVCRVGLSKRILAGQTACKNISRKP